eukprot:16447006-Heterocapsa_arctica.AAC.1
MSSGLDGKAYDGKLTRNKFGLGTMELQMRMCEFWLPQEDRKPGIGPLTPSTQPRWEESHDQKK